jgi:hypothetical protein
MNKRGDRGSPCLTPLLQWKTLPSTQLSKTDGVPEDKDISNPSDPFTRKPFVLHNFNNDLMLNLIKGLFKV